MSRPSRRRAACAALALAAASLLAGLASAAAPASDAGARLNAFFAAEWERGLREHPEGASFQGDLRFNDRWSDNSLKAITESEAEDRAALKTLQGFDRAALSPADQLNYDTYLWQLQEAIARQKFREYLQPVSHQGGVQTLDGVSEALNFAGAKDFRDWLARMRAVPTVVEQTMALMREGVKAGNLPPRVLMDRVPGQIASQVVADPEQSPFYRPFKTMPASIPATERDALRAEARQVVAERIVPAYRAFQTYFNTQYLPKTRADIAASALPDGTAYYDFLAGYYTTTSLTADEIHAIGLKEVARIRGEMEKVKAEVGFQGSMAEFFTFLRTDPRFFEKTPEALLERYRATAKRIDPELVKAFRTIPRQPYGVRPIPDNIAPDTTTAYYQQGAADGSRGMVLTTFTRSGSMRLDRARYAVSSSSGVL